MPLTGTGTDPVRFEGPPSGWSFSMRDQNGAELHVIVTDLALESLGSTPELESVHAHRQEIERLASAKHASGKVETDGTVKVTSVDVRESRAGKTNQDA